MSTTNTQKNLASTLMKGDHLIWFIYIAMFLFSIIEMASASARLAYLPTAATNDSPAFNHTKYLLGGALLLLLCQSSTKLMIRIWTVLTMLGSVFLLIALFAMGTTIKGDSVRSVFGIQPVEVCKVGVMMFICTFVSLKDSWYHRFTWFRDHTTGRRYIFMLSVIVIICVVILTQNLSSALIIGIASLAMLYLAQVRDSYLIKTLVIGGIIGAIGLTALKGLHMHDESRRAAHSTLVNLGPLNRAHTWANRIYEDTDDVPYWDQSLYGDNAQIIHAHMALANSYPLPMGPGNSRLRDHLPEAYSDYIFAIIFEEWSFLGAFIIMAAYLVVLIRCYKLSLRTRDKFYRLLIVALPLIMTIQALIHIGVCTDAMFVTGQPLPLISRGGSGIIMTSFSFGIILALSRIINADQQSQAATPDDSRSSAIPADGYVAETATVG